MPRAVWKVTVAACALTVFAACSGGGTTSGGRVVAGSAQVLNGNEARYGASPIERGPITFQPDVVFLGGGADAVRSVSGDGLVWTIDGHARNADKLLPGKILFATSLGAGRVLSIDQVGSDERVALGPVALTDIIKDGSFGTSAPIPLQGFVAYATPSQPGLETPVAQTTSFSSRGTSGAASPGPADLVAFEATPSAPSGPSLPSLPPLPPPSPDIPDSVVGSWNLQSVCCTSIGVHVAYDKGGARVQGTATLKFDKPGVTFDISIAGGHIMNASVGLHGAAGISFAISAAVEASASDFRGGRIQIPVDIAIPIPVGNIPVTVGIQQIFTVNLGLSGKAALSTAGEYSLSGSLGFSLKGDTATADIPTLATTKSALDAVQSIAVAPSALTFAYAVKVSIGVGPPGLSAGLWYQVAASLGLATSGSQIDQLQGTSLVTCKTVSLSVLGRYGVGYQIPALVAQALNFFLKAVMTHPPQPIAPIGGPSWGPTTLYEKQTPPCTK